MIDTNNIKCTLEDAWEEFERTGEITNSSENMLLAAVSLLKENENLLEDLVSTLDTAKDLTFFREGTSYYKDAETHLDNIIIKYKNEGKL